MIIGFGNQFFVFLRVAVLNRLYCIGCMQSLKYFLASICSSADWLVWSSIISVDWLQSLKQFFINVSYHLLVASLHAREPLYSNSAVIAWCSQSSGAQNILFWFTVIHSMSQYFTAFNFHDIFFIWNYCLGIVVHSGPIRAFKF